MNKKTMDSLTELTSYPDLPAEDVTVIPVTIRYKDAPEETYDVLFSDSESYSLTGEARDMTAAKNQMDTETKAQETTREHGSSLPFNGEDVL